MALARVACGYLAHDQPAFFERAQCPAQIACIQVELPADFACRRRVIVCDLVQHAGLGQRIGTAEKSLSEHADLPRVEAVEAAYGRNARVDLGHGLKARSDT